jgi:hypothetical protein
MRVGLHQRSLEYFKKTFLVFTAISLSIASVPFTAASTHAAPVTGFNPGRIIDDGVFVDFGRMSPGNIQYFLNVQGINCSNGEAPCLKSYTEGGRSSAQIIYDAAQEFQINPQVLLVTLQKEVGLVTISQPGAWRYRTAMGYGCPDSSPGVCNSQYFGFTNQIRWAARMFRAIMNASPTWYTPYVVGNNYIQWHPNSGCGGTNVYIQNRATQALYNYTPYQPNQAALNAGYGNGDGCSSYGNRNFYQYFKDWFGLPQQSSIVRSPSSETYYLLTNNKKFAIANGDILYAYGLESAPLSVVSDAYLATISDGGMLNTIYTIPGDNTVFMADGGKKYGIPSGEYCTRWGLACGDANIQKEIGPEIAGLLKDGGVIQPIMRFQNHYYLMVNGKKQHFLTPGALSERGYTLDASIPIINWTNATREEDISLPQNNSFLKFGSNSAIYLYSGNQFFSIPDYETYTSWAGLAPLSINDSTSRYTVTPPSVAGELNTLITNNGTNSLIGQTSIFSLPLSNPSSPPLDLITFPQLSALLSGKANVSIDDTKAVGLPNGSIQGIRGGELRPIPSMTDLWLNYEERNIIGVPSGISRAYPTGKLNLTPGRVFKPTDSGAMYIYGADRSLWALGSPSELTSVLKWTNDVVTAPFSSVDFTDIKIFPQIIKVNTVPYYVYPSGWLQRIPSGSITDSSKIPPIDGNLVKKLGFNTNDIGFIQFDNGTIFKVTPTNIRSVPTMSSYNSNGGNPSNTVKLPLKALSLFNVGSSL